MHTDARTYMRMHGHMLQQAMHRGCSDGSVVVVVDITVVNEIVVDLAVVVVADITVVNEVVVNLAVVIVRVVIV